MASEQEVPVVVTNATITFWFKPDNLKAFAREILEALRGVESEEQAIAAITYVLEARVGRLGVVAEASPNLAPRWKWYQFQAPFFKGKTCEEIDPAALDIAINQHAKSLTYEERDVILEYRDHLKLFSRGAPLDESLPLEQDEIP